MRSFWLSLRLHVQLALASIVVLTVTLTVVTWLNTQSSKAELIQDTTQDASSLTKSIAIFATHFVLQEKYDELEDMLIEYAAFPGIMDVTVISVDGQTLSQVEKQEDGKIVALYDYPSIALPKTKNSVLVPRHDASANTVTIWQPIATSSLIGWVKMRISLSHVDQLQQATILNNIKSTVIAIATDILIILLILYNPARKFNQVVAFSKEIVDKPGTHIDFSGGSLEIDSLIHALNDSSTKLQKQQVLIAEKTALLERLASVDPLTKISNRAGLINNLDRAIKNAKRNKTKFVVLFIDLNDFKPINDNFGHYMGDMLLQQFALRLEASVRETDMVARYGGDEFVVLLTNIVDETPLQKIISNIVQIVTETYSIDGESLNISLSLGQAVYPNDGRSPTELLVTADHGMYKDKKVSRRV
jgi:diguanylate cyclase (GGDEF)-like protein